MREVELGRGLRAESFLAWARERGELLPERAVLLVLMLLVWRGAKVRDGLPEPTSDLIRAIFEGDLPDLVAGDESEGSLYLRVADLLVDCRRDAGLLNAKRQGRLRAAIAEASGTFYRRLAAPTELTWPRFYATRLRADGVDPSDPKAVRAWLDAYRSRPAADRLAALAAASIGTPCAPAGEDQAGVGSGGLDAVQYGFLMLLTKRTDVVELQLHNLLMQNTADFARLLASRAGWSGDEGPEPWSLASIEDLTRDEEIESTAAEAADVLIDLGSAAGLSVALQTEFRDLAPRLGDRGTDWLVDEIVELVDEGVCAALPALDEPSAGEVAVAVRASPLLTAAADLSAWVAAREGVPDDDDGAAGRWPGADDLGLAPPVRRELDSFALAANLLRRVDGRLVPGDGLATWQVGDPRDVIGLGLDALGGVLVGLSTLTAECRGLEDDRGEQFGHLVQELVFLLVRMVEEIDVPCSLARLAAVQQSWRLTPSAMSAVPVALGTDVPLAGPAVLAAQLRLPEADSDYRLPSDAELGRLLGEPDLDDDDRRELLEMAVPQAVVVDRCAALGVLRREDDRIQLTPLGGALLRLAVRISGGSAPTMAHLAAADAATVIDWMAQWPARAKRPGVLAWVDAHDGGADAWQAILAASASQTIQTGRGLFALLGVVPTMSSGASPEPASLLVAATDTRSETALLTAMTEFVEHPVLGAYAAAVLRQHGRTVADPPLSARATHLGDILICLLVSERIRQVFGDPDEIGNDRPDDVGVSPAGASTDGRPERESREPAGAGAVCAAFDRMALDWPGGARELVRHLCTTRDPGLEDVLKVLADHSDQQVARASRTALRASQSGSRGKHGQRAIRRDRPRSRAVR